MLKPANAPRKPDGNELKYYLRADVLRIGAALLLNGLKCQTYLNCRLKSGVFRLIMYYLHNELAKVGIQRYLTIK